jgi:GMP synthase (glutamine-hydrolysing)
MRRPVIAVIQHLSNAGVGCFGDFAHANGLDLREFHGYAGEDLPTSLKHFDALCVLGGPMSANDDIAYLRRTEALIRDAVSDDKPVIGHCLGGQLMARAFGARITKAPVPEIGWLPISASPDAGHQDWFDTAEPTVFQWHNERFDIPTHATQLARSAWCDTQAFALGTRHIGMQFHCEITAGIIDSWLAEKVCQDALREHAPHHESVQDETALRADTTRLIEASVRSAHHIYRRWARAIQP